MSQRFLLLLCPLLLVACAAPSTEEDQDVAQADFETLSNCGEARLCPPAGGQDVEGGALAIRDMACVMDALRDRSAGSLRVELSSAYSNGSETWTYAIYVLPSGKARVAIRDEVDSEEDDAGAETTYLPAQICELEQADFFDRCGELVAEDPESTSVSSETSDCIVDREGDAELSLPWFTRCTDEPASCE